MGNHRLLGLCLRIGAMIGITCVLASCDCNPALEITSIQKSDKKLACKDIILEINEAEYYRAEAAESRKITFGELLMPTCWISGYVNGQQAIRSADARIDYLGHIYDLLDCGGMRGAKGEGDDEDMPVLRKPLHKALKNAPGQEEEEDDQEESSAPTAVKKDAQGKIYRPVILPQKK